MRAQDGDRNAETELIRQFTPMVHKITGPLYAPGCGHDDLVQEGLIGLWRAAGDFRPAPGRNFAGFAALCVRRALISYIIYCRRVKSTCLNEGEPIEAAFGVAGGMSPERVVLGREMLGMLRRKMGRLSELEARVLRLRAVGMGQKETARTCGCPVKMVDNALQRVKEKLVNFREEVRA